MRSEHNAKALSTFRENMNRVERILLTDVPVITFKAVPLKCLILKGSLLFGM